MNILLIKLVISIFQEKSDNFKFLLVFKMAAVKLVVVFLECKWSMYILGFSIQADGQILVLT